MQIVWWMFFIVGIGTAAFGAYILHKPMFDLVSEAIERQTGVYLSKSIVGFGAVLLLAGVGLALTAFSRLGLLF